MANRRVKKSRVAWSMAVASSWLAVSSHCGPPRESAGAGRAGNLPPRASSQTSAWRLIRNHVKNAPSSKSGRGGKSAGTRPIASATYHAAVAYDALAESVALIESRYLEPVRLSRRRRFAAMAVDVAGDIAATMFARRGVGCFWQETHVLVLRDGQWALLGGGGGTADQDLLADRPAMLPDYLRLARDATNGGDPRVIVVKGSGGVLDDGDQADARPGSGRWISYADVWVNAQVTSVHFCDRSLRVPWHGHVVLVWSGGPPSRVVAHDASGQVLGEVHVSSRR